MRLESKELIVEVDDATGSVVGLRDRVAGVELIHEPRLAESFRLLVPLPDLESNYVLGKDQSPPRIERNGDGARIVWDGPLSNQRGTYDIEVRLTLSVAGGRFEQRLELANRCPLTVTEAWYGFLGGMDGFGAREETETFVPYGGGAWWVNPFRNLRDPMGAGGGGGMRHAECYLRYPGEMPMPWIDLGNRQIGRGLYVACHEPDPRLVALHFDLQPGCVRSRQEGTWPSADETARDAATLPAGLVLKWVCFPWTASGGVFEGPALVIEPHAGGWREAAALYRDWFRSHFEIPPVGSAWLDSEQAVQDAMFLLPEGNLQLKFSDMPAWADDARRAGVTTVMISGWNVGGHDRGYPDYSPDPRLGTWDDLRAGIEACRKMGVRVLFFANIQPVDSGTEWYRNELCRYQFEDNNGNPQICGWGMGTLSARMGFTRPQLAMCDPAFPEFRKIIVDQMRRLAEIGADGIHLDKIGPFGASINFNPALPGERDRASLRGLIQCIEEILSACHAVRPDFCLSFESTWDHTVRFGHGWWNWHEGVEHAPALRVAFPEYRATFAAVWPWDYIEINSAVRYGYQILVGPCRYSASIGDPQFGPLAEYLGEIIRLRERLSEGLLFGELLDDGEARVASRGGLVWSVHRGRESGRRYCVVCNITGQTRSAQIEFVSARSPRTTVHEPFRKPRQAALPARVRVAAERLVIVEESE